LHDIQFYGKEYNNDGTSRDSENLISNLQSEMNVINISSDLTVENKVRLLADTKEMYSDLIFRAMKRENLPSVENLYQLFGQGFINDILLSIGSNLVSESATILTSIKQIPDINGMQHNMSDVEAYKHMQSGIDWRSERKREVLEQYREDTTFLLKMTKTPPKNKRQEFCDNILTMSMAAGNTQLDSSNRARKKEIIPKENNDDTGER
jgi:hypothetical protein